MLVIGLAGGVASGKSLVAQCFKHLGAKILDADQVGHEVLRDPEVVKRLVEIFSDNILNNGDIDRTALGKIVFDRSPEGTKALVALEQITHPQIGERIQAELISLKAEPELQAVVLDAPVMFKANWDRLCDKVVFVHADLELRETRARQRGWNDDEISKRESYQTPLDEKRSRSTDQIDNSQSKKSTCEQAKNIWLSWGLKIPKELDSPQNLF